MRKALFGFMLLSAVTVAAGADGAPLFRVTGQLQTGVQDVVTVTAGGASDGISLYDNDTGNPSRFRIGLYFTSPDGNWGLTARLDNEALSNAGTLSAAWSQALVWGTIFDRWVTVKAGLLDEEAFSFTWKPYGAEVIWGDEFDGTLGAEIQVRPLEGLQVGWILPIVHGSTMLETLESSYAAISYSLPDVLRVVGGLLLSPAYTTFAWVGVDVLAVKDLTARVAAQALNINNSYLRWLELFQDAGYPFGGILVDLKAWEELYAIPNSSVAWQVEPSVSYPVGDFTFTVLGDFGTLLALDPNPGVPNLPFGIAAGASVAYAPIPTSTIKLGALYKMGDVTVQNATVQIFVDFQWSF
jgi:hypothetical protein